MIRIKNILVKMMLIQNIFQILLFKGRSVSGPAQQVTGSKRVNFYMVVTLDF